MCSDIERVLQISSLHFVLGYFSLAICSLCTILCIIVLLGYMQSMYYNMAKEKYPRTKCKEEICKTLSMSLHIILCYSIHITTRPSCFSGTPVNSNGILVANGKYSLMQNLCCFKSPAL